MIFARREILSGAACLPLLLVSHQASLKLPQVQAAIARARPVPAGFGTRAEVIPAGGRH
jgi:hypothetical protein